MAALVSTGMLNLNNRERLVRSSPESRPMITDDVRNCFGDEAAWKLILCAGVWPATVWRESFGPDHRSVDCYVWQSSAIAPDDEVHSLWDLWNENRTVPETKVHRCATLTQIHAEKFETLSDIDLSGGILFDCI